MEKKEVKEFTPEDLKAIVGGITPSPWTDLGTCQYCGIPLKTVGDRVSQLCHILNHGLSNTNQE